MGDTISYSYLVTNSGNVSLTGPVTVADDKTTVSCPAVTTVGNLDGELDPSESVTCTATYTVTLADLNSGSVTNIASATADGTTSPTDQVTVNATQTPALTSVKAMTANADEDGSGTVTVGDTLTYAVTMTNTGNVSLADVVVTDNKITPNTITCASVAPAGTCVLTGTYRVTQTDADAGNVVNAAVITTTTPGACPVGSTAPECNPTVTVVVTQTPALTSVKAMTANADEDGIRVTQTDADAGNVVNAAVITTTTPGVCPVGSTAAECNPTVTVVVTQTPALTSVKAMTANADEDGSGTVTVGDTLTYSVTTTNTGNVTLADVVVTDSKITPNTITCASVAPAGTCVLTGTYRVTQTDADAGNVVNAAVITTTTPGVCPVGSTAAECNPTVTRRS
ncbi:hypothetical protein ASE43_07235 [Lysobacter sp. Root983]|nr:hypothetical protein ASE43_07235 [Lysobacter sp. Root983]